MATERTTLRRAIGDKLGDMWLLEATSNSANTSSFSDVVNLGDRGDRAPSIVNRIGYFSGGTVANLGHECRISDYTSGGATPRTLTFTPAANTEPQAGDELELWTTSERVSSISAIHRLINDAIRAVDRWAEPEEWDSAQTWSYRTQVLTIPSTWVEFGGADWTDGRGYRHEISASKLRVRPGQRTVEILGSTAYRANRRQVQLWGFDRSPQLTTDTGATGTTNVDPEWLVESVAGVIALAGSWKASDAAGAGAERRANFWATQSALYRRNVAAPRRGMGILLV